MNKPPKALKDFVQAICKNKPSVGVASNFTELDVELKFQANVDKSSTNLIPGDKLTEEAIRNKEMFDALNLPENHDKKKFMEIVSNYYDEHLSVAKNVAIVGEVGYHNNESDVVSETLEESCEEVVIEATTSLPALNALISTISVDEFESDKIVVNINILDPDELNALIAGTFKEVPTHCTSTASVEHKVTPEIISLDKKLLEILEVFSKRGYSDDLIKLISLLETGIYAGVAGGLATGILYTSNYLITANAIALSNESILTFYIENPELFTSSCG